MQPIAHTVYAAVNTATVGSRSSTSKAIAGATTAGNYTQAMLVQFCFFTAYLVVGVPGGWLVKRIGYMRGATVGLMLMMAGCLMFIPASRTATYGLFPFALFVLASGVVIVQVLSNPLISLLGP